MFPDIDPGGNIGNIGDQWKHWKHRRPVETLETSELLVRVGRVLAGALGVLRASGDPAPIGLGLLVVLRGLGGTMGGSPSGVFTKPHG